MSLKGRLFRVVVGLIVAASFFGNALASELDVSAIVPYIVPAQAATIDPTVQGATSSIQSFEVFGTCQTVAPYSIVVIQKQGTTVGSTACNSNGTYRVFVLLALGPNEIIARTANLSVIYGPDSSSTIITYNAPLVPAPVTPTPPPSTQTTGAPAKPAVVASKPSTPASNMELVSDRPFEVLDKNNSTQIDLNIKGGTSPYAVDVVWGDGSTQSLPVASDGKFSLIHTYAAPGKYQVKITVRDVLGSIVNYFHSVVSTNAASAPKSPAKSQSSLSEQGGLLCFGSKSWKTWVLLAVSWILVFSVGVVVGGRKRKVRDPVKGMLLTTKTSILTKKKTIIILVSIISLGLMGVAFSKYANSPVVVTAVKTRATAEVKGAQTGYNVLSTGLFEVSVPNTYAQKTSSETPDKPILSAYLLADNYKSGSSQIGMTIGRMEAQSLEDIAFIKQRRLESTNYTQVDPSTIPDVDGLVFTRNDGSEAAIFIKNGNKYASIVVSGQSGLKEKHSTTALNLLKTWRWL